MFGSKEEKKVAAELSNSSNTISKGTVIEGNIETFGNIRIEGKIIGNVKSKSKVFLGPSAHLKGDLLATNAEIEGEVHGVVQVSEQLVLKPSSKIFGDISTNKLTVESGAQFNGGCKMGQVPKEIKVGEKGNISNDQSRNPQRVKTV